MTNGNDREPVKVKIALLFLWCPEVDGGHLVETSASPEVAMRLEHVELLDDWQIEGLDVGGRSYSTRDPDLRSLELLVGPALRVTIRARNALGERRRFPGVKIIGTVVQ